MIGSTWNSLFVTVAMAAGMFAQQVAHKFSAASEDKQVSSVAGLEDFCSSQGYYLAGRFQSSAAESTAAENVPTAPESTDEPALATAEPTEAAPQPEVAATEPLPAGPNQLPSEPAVPEPTAGPDSPAPPAPQVASEGSTAAGAQTVATAEMAPPPATIAEPVPKGPAANMPLVASSENADEDSKKPDTTEILPPPTPEKEPRTSVGQFGAFDEQPSSVAPAQTPIRAPLPPTIAVAGDRRYPDVAPAEAGRYVSAADLVRERAVVRGEQRRQRVETRKWLGISPLRPSVPPNPYTTIEEPQQLILVLPHVAFKVQP